MNPMRPPKRFTLIELLVVVAVIAILASLLLPVLSTAREKARMLVCVNNLRQFGIVCHLYADDAGDFPPSVPVGPWNQGCGGKDGYQVDLAFNGGYIKDKKQAMCTQVRQRASTLWYCGWRLHYSWYEFGLQDAMANSYFPYAYFAYKSPICFATGLPWDPPIGLNNWQDDVCFWQCDSDTLRELRNMNSPKDANGYLLARLPHNGQAPLAACADIYKAVDISGTCVAVGSFAHGNVQVTTDTWARLGRDWRNIMTADAAVVTARK
jgi:prepilin-type N-terminal cleavage/methylation domain-containing protein